MDDQQLLRYSRHILLPEIGIEGQERLLDATALIIGLGGLGSPAALYLAASGVGKLILCDHDKVDFSNLQRQIIHRTSTVGLPKVESAQAALHEINPEVECVALPLRIDEAQLREQAAQADVVLDCSDNFTTRYAVNRVCLELRKPLVSGAAIQFDGQVSVFDFRRPDSPNQGDASEQTEAPCYNCLFPEDGVAAELRCATTGVFAPLVGIIGALQAAETLKLLMGVERGLSGRLLTVNALDMHIMRSTLSKDPACRACGGMASPLREEAVVMESCTSKANGTWTN